MGAWHAHVGPQAGHSVPQPPVPGVNFSLTSTPKLNRLQKSRVLEVEQVEDEISAHEIERPCPVAIGKRRCLLRIVRCDRLYPSGRLVISLGSEWTGHQLYLI